MSTPSEGETTLATKLRLYQRVLGYSDEALEAIAGAGALAALRSRALSPDDLATLSKVAGAMGVGPGDLLPDVLDPSNLEPDFAGMPRKQIQELHEMAIARSAAVIRRRVSPTPCSPTRPPDCARAPASRSRALATSPGARPRPMTTRATSGTSPHVRHRPRTQRPTVAALRPATRASSTRPYSRTSMT